MTELSDVLERARAQFPVPDLPMDEVLRRRDRKRRNERIAATVVGTVIALAVAGLLLAGHLLRSGPSPANTPSPQPMIPARHNGPIAVVDFSRGLVRVDASSGKQVGRLATFGGGEVFDSSWSPDGSKIAVVYGCLGGCPLWEGKGYGLFVVDPVTGGRVQLAKSIGMSGVDWSPDGLLIAYADHSRLMVVAADGSTRHEVEVGVNSPISVDWSPDGKEIIFGDRNLDGVYAAPLDGSPVRTIVDHGTLPAWSPDGRQIAYRVGCTLRMVAADGSSDHDVFHFRGISSGVRGCRVVGQFSTPTGKPSWSPDGRFIVVNRHSNGVVVVGSDGSNPRVLAPGLQIWGPPAWRPVP